MRVLSEIVKLKVNALSVEYYICRRRRLDSSVYLVIALFYIELILLYLRGAPLDILGIFLKKEFGKNFFEFTNV